MMTSLRKLMAVCLGLICSLLTGQLHAQNLVINGDFEAMNACPANLQGIDYSPTYTSFPTVKGWIAPIQTTPDYFNRCDSSFLHYSGVPRNNFGYQPAHSGNGYVGMITHEGIDLREYVSSKLARPMVKDSIYHISFYANSGDGGNRVSSTNETVIAVNDIGASLTNTLPYSDTLSSLNLPYSICNDTNQHLSGTGLWHLVAGDYIAKGGELWITLGHFTSAPLPAYTIIAHHSSDLFGYTYIDDVSIVPVGKHMNAGVATRSELAGVTVSPNPATDWIDVTGLAAIPGNKTVTLYSAAGAVVSHRTFSTGDDRVNISAMPAGIYFLTVKTGTGSGFYRIVK